MICQLTPDEFQLFKELIYKESGVVLGANKMALVQGRLQTMVRENGFSSFMELYQGVARGDGALRQQVIDRLTTHETFWFRDEDLFTALREEIVPRLWSKIVQGKRPKARIWSAACSTGQEPYSIAMSILEAGARIPGFRPLTFEILATDISRPTLAAAEQGEYSTVAIGRGLPTQYRQRYFTDCGRAWRIRQEVREMVRFRQENLQSVSPVTETFDLLFCRNVAIYFSTEGRSALFSRLSKALTPGGLLFLGATESVSLYCNALESVRIRETICYRLRKATPEK